MHASHGPDSTRRKKNAKERRQQRERAEARTVSKILKGCHQLLHHRGSQPSKLLIALSQALGTPMNEFDEGHIVESEAFDVAMHGAPPPVLACGFFDQDHFEEALSFDTQQIQTSHQNSPSVVISSLEIACQELESEIAVLVQQKEDLERECSTRTEEHTSLFKELEDLNTRRLAFPDLDLDDEINALHKKALAFQDVFAQLSGRLTYLNSRLEKLQIAKNDYMTTCRETALAADG